MRKPCYASFRLHPEWLTNVELTMDLGPTFLAGDVVNINLGGWIGDVTVCRVGERPSTAIPCHLVLEE